jgi:FAD/FMN-containing dehydrogenase
MGAGLGGGHGRLQGLHGLIADNIVSAEVVLADGEKVTASTEENPDLYWALRGAGHNFGIVTSFTYKVYPLVDDGDWWYANYIFTKDSIPAIFKLMNAIRTIQPAELVMAVVYVWAIPDSPEVCQC